MRLKGLPYKLGDWRTMSLTTLILFLSTMMMHSWKGTDSPARNSKTVTASSFCCELSASSSNGFLICKTSWGIRSLISIHMGDGLGDGGPHTHLVRRPLYLRLQLHSRPLLTKVTKISAAAKPRLELRINRIPCLVLFNCCLEIAPFFLNNWHFIG